ncbi:MAG: glycosyltransferase family 4 protein [Thiohalomonadaceae bacterium]
MKILELCLSTDLGGLELYMLRCVQKLAETDSVLAVVAPGGKPAEYLAKGGRRFVTLKPRVRALPLSTARQLARIIDREQIDVLHMHWGKDLPLAALAKACSRRKPALVYTRQMQMTRPKQDFYHRFLYRQVDRLTGITRALAEDMRRFIPEIASRIDYLYYGVAAPTTKLTPEQRSARRRELGVPEDVFLIGLFGRIKHYKGQHLLLDALARAKVENVPMHGLIVGRAMEQDYLEGLKARSAREHLPVTFKDFVEGPQALMQACDCVILTTVEETFGLVLVEAMRAGVPVVGSDRGGVPEIIEHGESGMLFRSGDGEHLYAQLLRLQQDSALARRLGAQGKAKADVQFADDAHFPELRRRLQALISAENAG